MGWIVDGEWGMGEGGAQRNRSNWVNDSPEYDVA